jgi:rfaE bifunctional protein nucleotidyltransferase chain/domain
MKKDVQKTQTKNSGEVLVKDILDPNINPDHRVINDYRILKKVVKRLKAAGFRIVLTQGVWDLIHEGHARYLQKAKAEGDILIVGVDSDELTRKRKGPRRPIVPEDERIRMISHLRHVDIITTRHARDEIGKLIYTVEPDVLIVSQSTGDFSKTDKNGYKDVCGKIIDLKHQATTSTSARIRNLTIEGAEELADKVHDLIENFLNNIKK